MKIPKLSSPEASTESSQAAVRAGRYGLDSLLDALAVAYIRAPRWGWVAPTLIVLLAGVLRFYNLAHPNAIVFDETYYAKDAYSYVHYGYELSWTKDANASFVAGHPSGILPDSPEYVVHPPLGKWMIAAGMAIFGDNNPFGWRVSAAVIGTLSVALIAYAAWLLFRSVTVSTIAALLAAVDGLMLVESRLALLDIFQMFWILATFVCLLLDRIHARRVLARNIAEAARQYRGELPPMSWGPGMGLRLWRVAAGVCAVMAVAVFVFLIPFNLRRVAEKQFDKSRLEGMRSNLTFYMDHYEEVNKLGRVAYKYVQLREIIETDTNFYLMKTNMQGCIVVKANCAPNLIKFLSKIKAQYKL